MLHRVPVLNHSVASDFSRTAARRSPLAVIAGSRNLAGSRGRNWISASIVAYRGPLSLSRRQWPAVRMAAPSGFGNLLVRRGAPVGFGSPQQLGDRLEHRVDRDRLHANVVGARRP